MVCSHLIHHDQVCLDVQALMLPSSNNNIHLYAERSLWTVAGIAMAACSALHAANDERIS